MPGRTEESHYISVIIQYNNNVSWARFEPGTCRMLVRHITTFFVALSPSSCHFCSMLLSSYNIHTRQTSMFQAGFDPTNTASERSLQSARDSLFLVFVPYKSPPMLRSQATANSLWNMNFYYRGYNSPVLDTVHSQLNPVQTLLPQFFKIPIIMMPHLCLCLPSFIFSFRFSGAFE